MHSNYVFRQHLKHTPVCCRNVTPAYCLPKRMLEHPRILGCLGAFLVHCTSQRLFDISIHAISSWLHVPAIPWFSILLPGGSRVCKCGVIAHTSYVSPLVSTQVSYIRFNSNHLHFWHFNSVAWTKVNLHNTCYNYAAVLAALSRALGHLGYWKTGWKWEYTHQYQSYPGSAHHVDSLDVWK